MQEVPGDDNVTRGYEEAKQQVERERNYDNQELITSHLKSVSRKKHLEEIITASGDSQFILQNANLSLVSLT